MTGINIQSPWSQLLIEKIKCVETRSYPLPEKYEGEELALIETPGRYGDFKARIIGTIMFSHSFKYPDEKTWLDDFNRHLVSPKNEFFGWDSSKEKYGWVVSNVVQFNQAQQAPENKGIIFTKKCNILLPSEI